jgi:hypothetical protein
MRRVRVKFYVRYASCQLIKETCWRIELGSAVCSLPCPCALRLARGAWVGEQEPGPGLQTSSLVTDDAATLRPRSRRNTRKDSARVSVGVVG